MRPALALAAVVLLAAPAVSRKRDAVPVATAAGKPVSCISIPRIQETRVRDDKTIEFIMRDRTVYRNTLPYSCPELGAERAFSYKTSISQLCSVDIVTVFRNSAGGPRSGASCGLGQFQPVTGVPR